MPLTLISEVVMNGGFLPQLAQLEKQSSSVFTRRNGSIFSLFWLIFWLLIMAVVFGGILDIEILGELFSVIGIFGGLLILLFSLFFLKKAPLYDALHQFVRPPGNLQGQQPSALPPQHTTPASAYVQPLAGSWRDTNDLQPSSVTENTTRFLDEKEKQ